MTHEHYVPLFDLSLIRRALDGVDVQKAKDMLDEAVRHAPGDLVQYQQKDGTWIDGVVVAWMMHYPSYVCGPGDDRNAGFPDGLLGCASKYVRPRGVSADQEAQ